MLAKRLAAILLLLARSGSCRDCGQSEIDARDITGCVTVLHMKFLGHRNAIWLGDALHHNADLETLEKSQLANENVRVEVPGLAPPARPLPPCPLKHTTSPPHHTHMAHARLVSRRRTSSTATA